MCLLQDDPAAGLRPAEAKNGDGGLALATGMFRLGELGEVCGWVG